MKTIEEKLKEKKTKYEIIELIGEPVFYYLKMHSGKPFPLFEFSQDLCQEALKRYGLMADVVFNHWGIKDLRDLAYTIRKISEEMDKKIMLEIPANPPKNFFSKMLNPKNIYLAPYQENSHIKIKYILGNNIEVLE